MNPSPDWWGLKRGVKVECGESYAVEGQFDVSSIQRGGALVWTDDWAKVLEIRVDFNRKTFVLHQSRWGKKLSEKTLKTATSAEIHVKLRYTHTHTTNGYKLSETTPLLWEYL